MEIERVRETAASYSRAAEVPEIKAAPKPERAETASASGTEMAYAAELRLTRAGTEEGRSDDLSESGEQGKATPSNAQIKKAVEEINKKANSSEVVFGVHEATNRVTIKIVDKESKEVLREFPPEKTLDMIAKVWEVAGLLVDEKR